MIRVKTNAVYLAISKKAKQLMNIMKIGAKPSKIEGKFG